MSVLRTPLGLTIGVLAAAILGSSSILLFRPGTAFLDAGRATADSSALRSQREVLFEHIENLAQQKLDLEERLGALENQNTGLIEEREDLESTLVRSVRELPEETRELLGLLERLATENETLTAEALRQREELAERLSATGSELSEALASRAAMVDENGVLLERLAALQAELTAAEEGLTAVKTEREARSKERDAALAEQATLQETTKALQAERDGLIEERDALTVERDSLTAAKDALGEERDALAKAATSAGQAAEAARKELAGKLRESDAKCSMLIEERAAAKKHRELLALRIEGFAAQLKALKDRLKLAAPILAAPTPEPESTGEVKRVPDRDGPPNGAPRMAPPKALTAKVAAVNDAEGIVVLDVGEAQGVREGTRFRIRRDGKPLATVKATRIQKQFSGCQILSRESPESIQASDVAELLPGG